MSIGNTIRKLRINREKTQQEMADFLNIDRRTYAKWEEEKTEVKSSLIPRIAEILSVRISDLYDEESNIQNNTDNKIIIVVTDRITADQVLELIQPKADK